MLALAIDWKHGGLNMAQTVEKNLLKTAEAAARADVDKATIRRWIAAGRLPAQRTATGIFRINVTDLNRVLSGGLANEQTSN